MIRVADVMTRRVVTVRNEASLTEASTYLATEHISGAGVTDHRDSLVGVISRSDIMEAQAEITEPEVRGRFLDETAVSELMTSPALTIGPEADLREAALAMEYGDVHRLFVQAAGKLVGVVSRSDVSRALATGRVYSRPDQVTEAPCP
jgi:CBS-domain-containing membrane protein